MPEMAARTLRLCLPPQKTPHAVRLLQEARVSVYFTEGPIREVLALKDPFQVKAVMAHMKSGVFLA